MKNIIYLDLDGVFANFVKKVEQLTNKSLKQLEKEDWDNILYKYGQPNSGEYLFQFLELLPGAKYFYKKVLKLKNKDTHICFLTSTSANKTNKRFVSAQKTIWVLENLGSELDIYFSNNWEDKIQTTFIFQDYIDTKHILIDDFEKQKTIWCKETNNIFIHHKGNHEETYQTLIKELNNG